MFLAGMEIIVSAAPLRQIRDRYILRALCHGCYYTKTLDHEALINRYGENYPIPELNTKLRCTRCGSRDCKVQVGVRNVPYG